VPADSAADRKKQKRRSSDKRHHHKHHRRSNKDATFPMEDPMDRLVASNVDEVLLDLLEEELPSVTFDGELPGSEPLELVDNFGQCDAMILCSSRKMRPRPFLRTPSTSSTSTLDAKDKPRTADLAPLRLAALGRSVQAKLPKRDLMPEPEETKEEEEEDDSSSEYTSACETISVASSDHATNKKPLAKSAKKGQAAFKSPKKLKPAAASPRKSSGGKKLVVPKLRIVGAGKAAGGGRKPLVAKAAKGPAKKRPRAAAAKPAAGRGRSHRALITPRRRKPSRKSEDDFDDVDDEEEEEDSEADSHEVFQLAPVSSKNLKLIVRKKRAGPPPRRAAVRIRKPVRVPIRRKKAEESDNSDDDDDDESDSDDDDSDVVSVNSEDEPVRGSNRLRTAKLSRGRRR
jgi:hypothetical protein